MAKQYYKLEYKIRDNGDKWIEFHTGPDHDDVQNMQSLCRALKVQAHDNTSLPTAYRVSEFFMTAMYEVSVFKLQRIS